MEKEGKIKVTRNSASAKNSNDINIKVMVGDQSKKKRVTRKRQPVAPPPVQNIVQLPPTEVAVPNVTFGRPQYNFTQSRPYDSPDGGMAIATFPELIQNYQSRQEIMGFPQQADMGIQTQTAEGVPVEEAQAPIEEVQPAPVADLPEGRPLTPEEIQMIAEEAGQRSQKTVALTKLQEVLSYIYNETDPAVLDELANTMFPEGTSSVDVWQQLGRMVQRTPVGAERDAVMKIIMENLPSTSAPALPRKKK